MTYINLPSDQKREISEVDPNILQMLVDKCLAENGEGPIHDIELNRCGPYVTSKLRAFQKAISEYAKSKASSKRERTHVEAMRAGSDLVHAVYQMKERVETEQKDRELFYIDDQIRPPFHLSERLSVSIAFHWRPSLTADWKYGRTTFVYNFSPRPDYTQLPPRRKPSAAKSARDLQDNLYREWEHLKMLALCSLRDFFRQGGDGDTVPKAFTVRSNPYGGGLNNSSCNFWQAT